MPITVIGGRGPHGLATHLWMRDRGLEGVYALVDPAPDWLPLYDDAGPGRFTDHLRSPHELDFALGDPGRSMRAWCEPDGQRPLADAYGFADVADAHANGNLPPARRVGRRPFLRYARALACTTGAEDAVLRARVERLTPGPTGWTVDLDDGRTFGTRVVLLATGMTPHLRVPESWRAWWSRLPADQAELALTADARPERLQGKRLAVLGSSNVGAWEAALWAARNGAHVTLLCRRGVPIERQLPFEAAWFRPDVIEAFGRLEPRERLRRLKRTHVPRSTLPGLPAAVLAHGVRVVCGARVQGATELWGGVQVLWSDPHGDRAEPFDLVWAATGGDPRPRELPFLANAVGAGRGPVVVGGPARQLPVMDAVGRWKQLPPLYPLGHLALPRAGLAATTLASASRYLPTVLPHALADAGLAVGQRAERRAPDPLEVAA
ncbi:MAG: hypothetical protein ABR510_02370 [Trueperaceae bacterium]